MPDDPTMFSRFELRTTAADAARAFYCKLFGHDRAVIWPLHEEAIARGARPHWLGFVGVDDVAAAAEAFVARGATRLGPTLPSRDGGQRAVFLDAEGAVVAVGTPPTSPSGAQASWHVLHAVDAARAIAAYTELFGWSITGSAGAFSRLAWRAGGVDVGAIGAVGAGVHPHWTFFFDVDVLEPAIATVRAAGGRALDPIVLPTGARACVCDDPQGAAFGLRER